MRLADFAHRTWLSESCSRSGADSFRHHPQNDGRQKSGAALLSRAHLSYKVCTRDRHSSSNNPSVHACECVILHRALIRPSSTQRESSKEFGWEAGTQEEVTERIQSIALNQALARCHRIWREIVFGDRRSEGESQDRFRWDLPNYVPFAEQFLAHRFGRSEMTISGFVAPLSADQLAPN